MERKKEFQKESWLVMMKYGTPLVLGIFLLVTSTLLNMFDVFPGIPTIVFQVINGLSIAIVILFGILWSRQDKKLQEKYTSLKN